MKNRLVPIVFDLDGTLVDSAPDLHAACVKMLADEGAPTPDLQTVIGYIGNGVPRLVELAMKDAGIAADQHAQDRPADDERRNGESQRRAQQSAEQRTRFLLVFLGGFLGCCHVVT